MTLTHQVLQIQPIHPFPARMAPSIVWDNLPDNGEPLRILDPMVGSGTSLVIARARGHQAVGCDTDPLAVLIAHAWCLDVSSISLSKRAKWILDEAVEIAKELTPDGAYPLDADDETKKFINFWFDETSRIQLTALSRCISHIDNFDEKELLWVAFSRLIITKKIGVSLAMDVSHSRPHRKYEKSPVEPFDKFLSAVDRIIKKAPFLDSNLQLAPAIVEKGDARSLVFSSNSFNLIITSPPYLNAIDYLRGSKLSLVWMGYTVSSLRSTRSNNIGSERSAFLTPSNDLLNILEQMGDTSRLDERHRNMIIRYLDDMSEVLSECRRVLKDNGQAVFVIGNSAIRGEYINNSEALISLAQKKGFKLDSRTSRIQEVSSPSKFRESRTENATSNERRSRSAIYCAIVEK
jgi:DNA modification methylase